jgi:RND family efflux transporter MFP subunit
MGNVVEANQTVLTRIVSTDPMHFYFDIDERSYLAYARDARTRGAALQQGGGGLRVEVRLADSQGARFPGRLDFAENVVDEASGTMRVRAVVPNPDGVLTPGLFGRINVPGSLPHDGVLLPDSAIASDQNRRVVYLVDGESKVRRREVRPGPRIDGYRVIRDGLDGSERVIVNGQARVRPGAAVTPETRPLATTAQ